MDRFSKDEAARVRWTFDGQEIFKGGIRAMATACLLYTSDAADES